MPYLFWNRRCICSMHPLPHGSARLCLIQVYFKSKRASATGMFESNQVLDTVIYIRSPNEPLLQVCFESRQPLLRICFKSKRVLATGMFWVQTSPCYRYVLSPSELLLEVGFSPNESLLQVCFESKWFLFSRYVLSLNKPLLQAMIFLATGYNFPWLVLRVN
jgi:hypothetical protein